MDRRDTASGGTTGKGLTLDAINAGIQRLERRIDELHGLDRVKGRARGDAITAVDWQIRQALREVFGPESPEFTKYGGDGFLGITAYHGVEETKRVLEALIELLKARRESLPTYDHQEARDALRTLRLHQKIHAVAVDLFDTEHYSEAVFAAAKALVLLVKDRAARPDLDGAPLMFTVFSKNAPILAVNDLIDQTDRDEQEGFMHLCAGAVLAIRNPGGHAFPEEPPDRALELLAFLSFLAKRADAATKR